MKNIILTFAALLVSAPVLSATLKIATITPEGSQWMTDMRASAADIKERTEGRVKIRYYGGGIMGNDNKVLTRIRIGSLQGGALTPVALASQYSDLNVYGLPMVFESEEEAAFVRSHMDAKLSRGLEQAGYVNFGFAAGGFAILMSNTPVRTLADMQGKKVWIPEGDKVSYAAMEALSLSPVTLPLTDVLTGLQTGLIDIVGMSPIGALVLQWHTKIKYVTEFPLIYTLGFMAVDKKAFNKISPEDQAIVRDVMTATYRKFDKSNLIDNRGAYAALINSGIERVQFDSADHLEISERMKALNERLGDKGYFSKAFYDEMLCHVAEYRSSSVAEIGTAN